MRMIGVSWLRAYNGKMLKELAEPVLVAHRNEPLAVLVPYARFLEWQEALNALDVTGGIRIAVVSDPFPPAHGG